MATRSARSLRRGDAAGAAQLSLWGKETAAKAAPFVKWAGGKTQLLPKIRPFYPRPDQYETYFEPFLGGGAVYFDLRPKSGFLSDSNAELINAYTVVRTNVDSLILRLTRFAERYRKSPEATYYQVRDEWDEPRRDPVERAAGLIFLNKTCYNGLYRVNRDGKFNVPWGKRKNPTICEREKLLAASDALHRAVIRCTDFHEALSLASSGDFVYLDPPYKPVSKTASFTGYTKDQFTMNDQISLAQALVELDRKGVRFLLSNSFSKDLQSLYRKHAFQLTYVTAPRAISCNPKTRGQTKELLVRNY